MFGFGDKQAEAIDEAERYMGSMFAGVGGGAERVVPGEALADPYVIGFLQVLTTHAAAVVYRLRMPDEDGIADIMAAAAERLAPGYGAVMRQRLKDFADPARARHDDYLAGRHAGSEHVRGLLATDDLARLERHRAFREYVEEHYL